MGKPVVDLTGIDANANLTPVVGWRSGRKVKLRQLTAGKAVLSAFREVVRTTLEDLAAREAEMWTPEADLSPETYLVIPQDDLGTSPELASEHVGQTFAGALRTAEALETLHPRTIPAADLALYAFVVGDVPGERTVFLRRSNPRRGLKNGRIFTFLTDSLERIDEPIFAFDEYIDLVFTPESGLVLSQTAFAALFRDQDALAARVPTWASDLHSHTPMTEEGRERLTQKALRDTRVRARLEAIVRRGHLSQIGPDKIRNAMVAADMDPDGYMNAENELVLNEQDIPQVLHLLNEDLFSGALTDTGFRADKKATR